MSTRKSTLASPTAQGTKVENASSSSSTTHTTKSLEKTNSSTTTADKAEMGANASSNTNIVNTNDPKVAEQIQKTNQDTKPFQQRVTRNSPLLLASPAGGITIKKEPVDSSEHHTNSESEEGGGVPNTGNTKKTNIRGRKSIKEHKELPEKEDKLEDLENKDKVKDKEEIVKEVKEESGEKKEQTEQKDKESTTTSPSATTASNRLTRKSLANQEVTNTRVTRQRQSSGASARSETPPARARSSRGLGRGKMPVPMIDPTPIVTKRKRSVDVDNAATGVNKNSNDEPGPKYIKIEVKDPDLENEEVLLSSQNTNASSEGIEEHTIKIKQEILDESENEMSSTTESNTTTNTNITTVTTNTGRGKGRQAGRKSTNNTSATSTTNNSPSTRATRQTKQNSPVQSTTTTTATTSSAVENKRRRMGSQTRSLLKTNVGSNAKNQPVNGEEEDSKDSTASSTNTDDIVLALIKSEKISMELDDDNTNDAKELSAENEEVEEVKIYKTTEESNDLPSPLVVDTDVAASLNAENSQVVESAASLTPVAASCSSVASGSEKAASLSPSELVSEGVSEISVKQFYKKPKFLENNLGIEEDPKLGNIVQKVAGLETTETNATTTTSELTTSTSASATTPTTALSTSSDARIMDDSYSNESLKEGTLRFEESIEDKKSISQDDGNSLSSNDNLTPLLIVEDDDDDEPEEPINIKENETQLKPTSKVEKHVEDSTSNVNDLSDVTEKETAKLNVIEVEDDESRRDQDQEDELTLEESETISMDNNASINDEVATEIEDAANEENITEIEDITDLTEVIEQSNDLVETEILNIQDKINIDDDKEIKENENPTLINIDNDANISNVAAPTAEDEDNDVLAKIDAELKKIDERSKEKLMANEENKPEDNIVLNPKDDGVKISIDDFIITSESMDVETDAKLPMEDAKDITKEDSTIDDVLDIKLYDEQPFIIAEEIKLLDDKEKPDEEEDVGIGSDMDSLVKEEEKADIKNNVLKATSDTEMEALNGKPTPTSSSGNSPIKTGLTLLKDDDTTSMKSGQSATSWITLDLENDDEETLRKKELHLQNLGLVTHKAAEKRRLEVIQSSAANVEASKAATQHQHNKRNGKNSSHAASTHHEYTGTLKTIIKINRNSTGGSTSAGNGRKSQNNAAGSSATTKEQQQRRQSLKMTFQKGRARAHGTGNNDRSQPDREGHGEDSYYTIQNETEGALQKFHNFPTTSTTSLTRLALTHTNNNNNIVKNLTTTYARKSYNYRYNHQHHTHSATSNNSAHIYEMDSSNSESHDHMTGVSTKKDEKEEILIPEKASSFKFHPGRLCEDQCFYCSGKFGLYDTPCHVGQIKSMERQQKILANEEKLTVDNCLCDACFRHVDRRANVPSYKKRLSAPGNLESLASTSSKSAENQNFEDQNTETDGGDGFTGNAVSRKCLVPECTHPAAHSLRRKCIRKSVKKFLLKFEIPAGAASVWLCQSHYDTVIQCSGCVLCKRRLGKNHMYHITSDTDRLEKALCEMGIPVQLGIGTAVCKLCRYFANLLMKPPDSTKSQKAEFVKNYRKRLLQFHNIHDGSNDASEADEDDSNSNSASNNDNNEMQQKTTGTLQQENDETSANQTEAPLNLEDSLAEKSTSHVTKIGEESSTTNNIERDFETAGISTDSSNSSVSNTASNSPNEMSKLKAILQSNASSEKQPSADISNVLRANPNISMRELFPGEEDLGLQFKVPFGGSGSQRTPEGWTRVQTFLQYDEPTRRLWEELQKPYGNQSSFLRHLILLEKYFRNGDLILSASASNNASVYTQTVRQRLTSYDKGHCGGLHMGTGTPKENATNSSNTKTKEIDPQIPTFVINEDDDDEDSEDQDVEMTEIEKIPKSSGTVHKDNSAGNVNKQQLQRSRSLSVDKLTKQLSSNAVTITARPKDSSSASNSKRATPSPQKSLLKDNIMASTTNTSNTSTSANLAAANAAAAVALAASTASAAVGGPSNSRSILKCNLLGINKSVEILPISNASSSAILKTSSNPNAPPPPPPAPILPVPETKQQKILDVANKLLGNHLEATAAQQNKNQSPLPSSPPELVSLQRRSTGQVMAGPTANANSNQQSNNLIKRPQLLGKPGTSRPPPNVVILPDTLTPQERLQSKTWRPTLMPVEENQNLLNKNGPLYQTADGRRLPALVQVQSGGKPFLISIFDYNRMCILRREKLMRDQMLKATKKRQEAKQQQAQAQQQQQQQQQQQHLQNQQQQQQFQKTNFQNMMKSYQTSSATINQRQQQQQQTQEQVAHQQFIRQQLLQHQEALLRKAAAAANNSSNSQNPPRYQAIAPKPTTSNITTMPPLQAPINTNVNFTAPMMPLLANAITNAANTGNVNPASTSASLNNTSWLWNNFPDANQLLLNGGAASGSTNVPKLPQLLAKPNNPSTTLTNAINVMKQQQQQQQQQQHQQQQLLLSKIPKSLTVIPQHKLMNNSASGAASGNNSGNLMKE